jgi:hypothetical protein
MRSGARREVEQDLTVFDLNFDFKLGRAPSCEILISAEVGERSCK